MIPAMILLGIVLGRWWRVSLVVSAFGWPILLVATDTMNLEPGLLAAASLAVLNTGVGVLIHQGACGRTDECAGPWLRVHALDRSP